MQRFFVESYQVLEEEHRITLTGPDLNHMKNVLRMRIGEDVWISDGSEKEYHCTIEEFQEDSAVLHILYAQESQYELPSRIYLFQGLPKGDKMELDFGQKQDGFQIKGTTLKGFTIAGPDRVFYPAEAMVQNGKIIVFSPEVSIPLAARYGWADNPDCNLYGENGLPVAPFRTDCW